MNTIILAAFLSATPLDPSALPQSAPIIIELAQTWSCTPRRYCTQIATCAEAEWYYQNCSWGYHLDGDSDGIPCEKLCGSNR